MTHSGSTRILGIDPGSRITGYGIIESQSGQSGKRASTPSCLAGGCLRLTGADMASRFGQLFHSLTEIIETYQPHEVAIEQVFMHKNAASALKLGQARGVAIAAVVRLALPVFEYAPRLIKQAIVGRGGADKNQVQHMIKILLRLTAKPQADAADALAVALCHHHTEEGKRAYDRSASRHLN